MNATTKKLQDAMTRHQAGDLHSAREAYLQVLQQEPLNADAWQLLGLVAFQAGDSTTAKECMEQSLSIDSRQGHVYANLGVVLASMGEDNQAEITFRKALELDSNNGSCWNGLGSIFRKRKQFSEAEECFRKAEKSNSNNPDTFNNWGLLKLDEKKPEEALRLLDRAYRLNGNDSSIQVNRGSAFRQLRRIEEAFGAYRDAIRLSPNSAVAYYNLAVLFQEQTMMLEAAQCYRQAIALPGGNVPFYYSNLLFVLNFDPKLSSQEIFEEHRRWADRFAQLPEIPLKPRNSDPQRRLKIGYVSPDFRNHPVPRFVEPLLANHDHSRFEIFAYVEVDKPDSVTNHLKSFFDHWRFTVGKSNLEVAQQIAEDEIDILIDLAGHTANNRLLAFAHRPAPIQITWMGYPNTTGMKQMDYLITDEILDPPGTEMYFTEELIRLPCSMSCFQLPGNAPEVKPLPALQNGYVTFGSLHRPEKLMDGVFDLWARVLQATPNSRLLIFWGGMDRKLQQQIEEKLVSRGIAIDRFTIDAVLPEEGYLEVYNRIDIGLDVFPWTGGTTTHEALWMGVVVLGLKGAFHGARGTMRILHFAGLPELITQDQDDYVRKAVEFVSDPVRLAKLRIEMRDRLRSTLCNAEAFTRTLERTYRELWHRWCARQATGS
jgi:protein O-GlcNAc transferase